MHSEASRDTSLSALRATWPARVRWQEVREADPGAFRTARLGALLLLAALAAACLTALVYQEPAAMRDVPGWESFVLPLLCIALPWITIALVMFGSICVSRPSDVRREIAIRRFAEAHGLTMSRFGFTPPRAGVMFAESPTAVQMSHRRRATQIRQQDPYEEPSLFRSSFVVWQGGLAYDPDLQVAIANYNGKKGDRQGPRQTFRYLALRLPRDLPHIVVDSLRNGKLRQFSPVVKPMSFEGDFDKHFTVYVPAGYERDALELFTPDVMACLIDAGRGWDIEIVEDRMIVASGKVGRRHDQAEITALLRFAELFGAELEHQAQTYSDPRAAYPRTQVAAGGQRLARRSGIVWVFLFLLFGAVLVALPNIIFWFIDRW
ncbi:hypothetical protein ICM05_02850 [Leucobacter sp. cx-42]|uniref:hypothetical protein n=1 Tax=unclassified Leucobacter TaxID=2621730 RepID=UPI00165E148F|nr:MULTISPECIES: hypothetical protein [unclassified Leucobacter]MBC9953590.1 hypothetical protein [Leucobacter sp. cx-42]